MTREVSPPSGTPSAGPFRVFASDERGWHNLCISHAGVMERVYADLTTAPFPVRRTRRHHRLFGRLKDYWEWEVGGGARVRYKRGPDGNPVVVYAGSHPPDTE